MMFTPKTMRGSWNMFPYIEAVNGKPGWRPAVEILAEGGSVKDPMKTRDMMGFALGDVVFID